MAATAPADYKRATGPYAVNSVARVTLRDAGREKDLWIRVTHPDAPGPFPLIVYSHGHLGSKDNYVPLVRHWASHGYVVIQPSHADSILLQRAQGATIEQIRARLADFSGWRDRVLDMSFILDSLDAIERDAPSVRGKIDRDRIGVGGHSYGAGTSALIGGTKVYTLQARNGESLRDPRVRAVVLVSGQGRGGQLREDSWRPLTLPAMVITGSNDVSDRTGKPPEWRIDPFTFAPPGDKYLVFITGADHGFGGIAHNERGSPLRRGARAGAPAAGDGADALTRALTGHPPNPDHVDFVRMATTAFWDAHLKADPAARAYLHSEGLAQVSGGAVKVTRK